MKLSLGPLSLLYGAACTALANPYRGPPSPQHVLLESDSSSTYNIPTRYESTVLARRLLALSRIGTLSTTFPTNITNSRVPPSVANTPIGLPDYIASCEEPTGNPTLLALTVSTSTRNVIAGSNASLALSWWDEYVHLTHHEPWSAANLPRASLTGYLEEIPLKEAEHSGIPHCFTSVHKDSKWWLPGSKGAAHSGVWMRMVVQEIYWIGGFGDRAFIGWFDPEEWRNVTTEQWKAITLPGEAGA